MRKYLIWSIAVLISIVLLPILAYQMGFDVPRHAITWATAIMGAGFIALMFLAIKNDFKN